MAFDLGTTPEDPTPGATGHFAHHVWLKDAVLILADPDTGALQLPETPTTVAPPSSTSGADLKTTVDALVNVLDALGLITKGS